MRWLSLLDAYGRPARPDAVPVVPSQLRRDLYEAARDETVFGWLARVVLGPDGQAAEPGFVVRFMRYEELP